MRKPILRPVLIVAAIVLTCTCGLGSATESGLEKVRLIGRFLASEGQAEFEWPGSAIEIRFQGAWLDVVLADTGKNSMVLDVDGNVSRIDLKKGEHSYRIEVIGDDEPHIVRLVRRTESSFGATVLKGARTDGSILPPQSKPRSVLVIGDSVSAGYGIEGKDTSCGFSSNTENQYWTFGAVAARRYDADVTTLAVSGKGLVRNYDGSGENTMRDLYTRLLPSHSARQELPKFSVIVVHLGSNDFGGGARPADFAARYADLLAQLRTTAPDAMIYAGIGPMLSGADFDAALSAVDEAVAVRGAQGDAKVSRIQFTDPPGGSSRGCDWHPNLVGHRHMADELSSRISADLGWAEAKK